MPQKPWHEQLVRVEIARHPPLGGHYGSSQPYPGFSLDDSDALRGTRADMPVTWNGSPDLSALAGKPVYLRFEIINMASLRSGSRTSRQPPSRELLPRSDPPQGCRLFVVGKAGIRVVDAVEEHLILIVDDG